MRKFFVLDIKKQKRRYRIRTFAFLVPLFQFDLVMLFLYLINVNWLKSTFSQKTLFLILIASFALTFLLLLIISFFCRNLIKAHKINTFIEVCDNTLIISRYSQTVFSGFKKTYYKNIYITKLSELKSISVSKGNIFASGKIRAIYDKADRLHYSYNDKDIQFDCQWYDYNSNKEMNSIHIPDVFSNTPRLLKILRHASSFEKARIERRKQYHEQMMARAKNIPLNRTIKSRVSMYK